jgi:hypothetical protein
MPNIFNRVTCERCIIYPYSKTESASVAWWFSQNRLSTIPTVKNAYATDFFLINKPIMATKKSKKSKLIIMANLSWYK